MEPTTPPAVRERTARRRPLGTIALLGVVALLLLAIGRAMPWPDRGNGDERRGFQLDQGAARPPIADDDLPLLDHPVPADLEAHVPPVTDIPAALEGEEWFVGGFQEAQGWSFQRNTVWRPTSIYPVLDIEGAGLTVTEGLRQTWQPPPCECPTVRVWMYGGSTAYGLNQRDEHTIASELARVAHEDGLQLIVENRGVLGYLHWLEAERFAYDLTIDPPPDVALFYDGVNETWAGSTLNNRESGDVRMLVDPTNVDVWSYTDRSSAAPPSAPASARVIGWDRNTLLGWRALAEATVERYDRARSISQSLAEQHGVQPIYAWQPSRVSRDLVPSEPHGDATEERYVRIRDQLQRELLPDDVIDLVDVFDSRTDPLFTDDVHHNEVGARIVAEALYAQIEPDLRRIAERRGGGR